jgi:lysine 2,3-aminomutase
MYCRFCFRKTLLNAESDAFFEGGLTESLDYLRQHTEIEEVILSGGDPLMVSDENLKWTLRQLAALPSIERVRIHSRVPVTFPERITPELVDALDTQKPIVLVTHFNHPKELTNSCRSAIAHIKARGLTVLNQSVLLKRVNDKVETLKQLMVGLFEMGVLPYYLHHPDQAAGTAHFQLSQTEGLTIYEELKKCLPGYLVPRYVVDTGDALYKIDV